MFLMRNLVLLLLLIFTVAWDELFETNLQDQTTLFTCLLEVGLNCIFH